MSTYPAPPADGLRIQWTDRTGAVVEDVSLRWENEAWTVDCQLSAARAQLVMRVSAGWQVRQVLLFRDLPEPDLWLAHDGAGRWGEVNGAHRDELDGCTEVVVADSAATNLPPLRRLPLLVGHAADMRVAVINPETLAVTPARWRYHRLGEHRWQIEAHGGQPTQPFDVDRYGLPVDVLGDVPGERRRLSPDVP